MGWDFWPSWENHLLFHAVLVVFNLKSVQTNELPQLTSEKK